MIKVAVIGAAGRMGRRLVANLMESNTLELAGALEYPGSPFTGQDAGIVAGCGASGVLISDSLDQLLLQKIDAVINFSTDKVIEASQSRRRQLQRRYRNHCVECRRPCRIETSGRQWR